jgi:very-short-patch-repair endonuclease
MVKDTRFKKGNKPWNTGTKGVCKPWNKLPTKQVKCACCDAVFVVPINSKIKYAKGHYQKRMKGGSNPSCNPEVKEKIRNTLLKTYADYPEILINRKPSGINQYSDRFSSLEKIIKEELDKRGIPYTHNCKIGRYFPDFIIGERVIIECDGSYWHRNDTPTRDKFLTGKGEYYLFHLKEERILNNPKECIETVLCIISELEPRYNDLFKYCRDGASGFSIKVLPKELICQH